MTETIEVYCNKPISDYKTKVNVYIIVHSNRTPNGFTCNERSQ